VHVMQYEITLPADYDMGTIRARVAARGHVFDDRAGLGLKAFVIRTRGVEGSPVNQYAPFYLWVDSGAMSHFLVGGGGLERIVSDFGRPTVHHWAGVGFETGPARGATPSAAARRLTPVSPDVDLVTLVEDEMDQLRQMARHEDVHSTALALDPLRWQLVRFTLSTQSTPDTDDATERYEVLHLSTPHIADLPTGRHW
jgi:hypothetical protein